MLLCPLRCATCREEQERFNVWVAYLNMENLYGSEEGTLRLLSRALAHTDARKMYLAGEALGRRGGSMRRSKRWPWGGCGGSQRLAKGKICAVGVPVGEAEGPWGTLGSQARHCNSPATAG